MGRFRGTSAFLWSTGSIPAPLPVRIGTAAVGDGHAARGRRGRRNKCCNRASVCPNGNLLPIPKFSLQGLWIMDDDFSPFHANQVLRLKPAEIARDKLADGSDLCRQFLIGSQKLNLHTLGRLVSVLRHAEQERNETVPDSAEGKLLNDSHQSTKPPSHDSQNEEH